MQPADHRATSTVRYDPRKEESARGGWYLNNRDDFVHGRVGAVLPHGQGSVLDVGCGSGGLLGRLQQCYSPVLGVDRDWQSLQWGRARGRAAHILQADALTLPFRDGAFDLAVSSEMLEHVPDHVGVLREILRVSRGPVVFTVPAHDWLWTDSDRILMHHRRYSRRDVEQLVADAGGRLLRLHPFGVIPMLGVLGYRLLHREGPAAGDCGGEALPLASRYRIPDWVNRLAGAIFRAELALSQWGLIPVGHAWWGVVERGGDR